MTYANESEAEVESAKVAVESDRKRRWLDDAVDAADDEATLQ